MQSGLQNCCRQCCSQYKQVPPRNLQTRLAPPSTNQQQNTNFYRCPNDDRGCGENGRVILVCCKKCVVGDAVHCIPSEFKPCPPPTCDCCACKKCPLGLLKRICERAWEDLERLKPCQERYPLFDGGRTLSHDEYPPRRSDKHRRKREQSEYRRDRYGKGNKGYEDRSLRHKGSYEDGVRDKKGRRRRRDDDSDDEDRGRKKKYYSNRRRCDEDCKGSSKDSIIRGAQDTECDDDLRGRKRRKSRRKVREDCLDERTDKRSKKNKRGKSKSRSESDDEDNTQVRNKGRDKIKRKSGKLDDGGDVEEKRKGKGKRGADDNNGDNRKQGADGIQDDSNKVRGDGKGKPNGNRTRNNFDNRVDGIQPDADKSGYTGRPGQGSNSGLPINRGKSGPGRKGDKKGNNGISARAGQLGSAGRSEKYPDPTGNTNTLGKSVPPVGKLSKRLGGSARLQGIDISDVNRVRLEVSDLRRRAMNRPPTVCPCQPCNSYRCLRDVCTSRPLTCPVPCVANTNNCCSTRCCL